MLRRLSGCLSRTASRNRPAEVFTYDPERQTYCMITVRRPGATLPDRHGRGSRPCYETNVGSFQSRRDRFNKG